MMHDSRPWTNPAYDFARSYMERVANIHAVHLAVVTEGEDSHVLEFEEADAAHVMQTTLPHLVRATGAERVIISSPDRTAGRDSLIVAIMDRRLDVFSVPIVRIINSELLVGDFRPVPIFESQRYRAIFDALTARHERR